MDESLIDQLIDDLVPQSLDVQGPARGKMQQGLLALGGAVQSAGAPGNGLVCRPLYGRTAFRATWMFPQEFPGRMTGRHQIGHRSSFRNHGDDVGNHVAGPTHDHRIANPDILTADFVLVVEGRIGDRDAADEDGF